MGSLQLFGKLVMRMFRDFYEAGIFVRNLNTTFLLMNLKKDGQKILKISNLSA